MTRERDYRALQKYLEERYADRVVLTFTEIEDLIGCLLATSAVYRRVRAPPSVQSDAWRLANRSAVVNFVARNVVFDRQPLPVAAVVARPGPRRS